MATAPPSISLELKEGLPISLYLHSNTLQPPKLISKLKPKDAAKLGKISIFHCSDPTHLGILGSECKDSPFVRYYEYDASEETGSKRTVQANDKASTSRDHIDRPEAEELPLKFLGFSSLKKSEESKGGDSEKSEDRTEKNSTMDPFNQGMFSCEKTPALRLYPGHMSDQWPYSTSSGIPSFALSYTSGGSSQYSPCCNDYSLDTSYPGSPFQGPVNMASFGITHPQAYFSSGFWNPPSSFYSTNGVSSTPSPNRRFWIVPSDGRSKLDGPLGAARASTFSSLPLNRGLLAKNTAGLALSSSSSARSRPTNYSIPRSIPSTTAIVAASLECISSTNLLDDELPKDITKRQSLPDTTVHKKPPRVRSKSPPVSTSTSSISGSKVSRAKFHVRKGKKYPEKAKPTQPPLASTSNLPKAGSKSSSRKGRGKLTSSGTGLARQNSKVATRRSSSQNALPLSKDFQKTKASLRVTPPHTTKVSKDDLAKTKVLAHAAQEPHFKSSKEGLSKSKKSSKTAQKKTKTISSSLEVIQEGKNHCMDVEVDTLKVTKNQDKPSSHHDGFKKKHSKLKSILVTKKEEKNDSVAPLSILKDNPSKTLLETSHDVPELKVAVLDESTQHLHEQLKINFPASNAFFNSMKMKNLGEVLTKIENQNRRLELILMEEQAKLNQLVYQIKSQLAELSVLQKGLDESLSKQEELQKQIHKFCKKIRRTQLSNDKLNTMILRGHHLKKINEATKVSYAKMKSSGENIHPTSSRVKTVDFQLLAKERDIYASLTDKIRLEQEMQDQLKNFTSKLADFARTNIQFREYVRLLETNLSNAAATSTTFTTLSTTPANESSQPSSATPGGSSNPHPTNVLSNIV